MHLARTAGVDAAGDGSGLPDAQNHLGLAQRDGGRSILHGELAGGLLAVVSLGGDGDGTGSDSGDLAVGIDRCDGFVAGGEGDGRCGVLGQRVLEISGVADAESRGGGRELDGARSLLDRNGNAGGLIVLRRESDNRRSGAQRADLAVCVHGSDLRLAGSETHAAHAVLALCAENVFDPVGLLHAEDQLVLGNGDAAGAGLDDDGAGRGHAVLGAGDDGCRAGALGGDHAAGTDLRDSRVQRLEGDRAEAAFIHGSLQREGLLLAEGEVRLIQRDLFGRGLDCDRRLRCLAVLGDGDDGGGAHADGGDLAVFVHRDDVGIVADEGDGAGGAGGQRVLQRAGLAHAEGSLGGRELDGARGLLDRDGDLRALGAAAHGDDGGAGLLGGDHAVFVHGGHAGLAGGIGDVAGGVGGRDGGLELVRRAHAHGQLRTDGNGRGGNAAGIAADGADAAFVKFMFEADGEYIADFRAEFLAAAGALAEGIAARVNGMIAVGDSGCELKNRIIGFGLVVIVGASVGVIAAGADAAGIGMRFQPGDEVIIELVLYDHAAVLAESQRIVVTMGEVIFFIHVVAPGRNYAVFALNMFVQAAVLQLVTAVFADISAVEIVDFQDRRFGGILGFLADVLHAGGTVGAHNQTVGNLMIPVVVRRERSCAGIGAQFGVGFGVAAGEHAGAIFAVAAAVVAVRQCFRNIGFDQSGFQDFLAVQASGDAVAVDDGGVVIVVAEDRFAGQLVFHGREGAVVLTDTFRAAVGADAVSEGMGERARAAFEVLDGNDLAAFKAEGFDVVRTGVHVETAVFRGRERAFGERTEVFITAFRRMGADGEIAARGADAVFVELVLFKNGELAGDVHVRAAETAVARESSGTGQAVPVGGVDFADDFIRVGGIKLHFRSEADVFAGIFITAYAAYAGSGEIVALFQADLILAVILQIVAALRADGLDIAVAFERMVCVAFDLDARVGCGNNSVLQRLFGMQTGLRVAAPGALIAEIFMVKIAGNRFVGGQHEICAAVAAADAEYGGAFIVMPECIQ